MNYLKEKAIKFRKKGKSLNEISYSLKLPKSTASLWLKNIKLGEKARKKLLENSHSKKTIEKRRQSRLRNEKNKRAEVINQAAREINKISSNDLKLIGVSLYWAEGSKSSKRVVSFSNSDPYMVKVMMKFFREICKVPENKFRGHIHIHNKANIKDAEMYWSSLTSIPLSQFYKTYAIKSVASKGVRKTLAHGTLDIDVCDSKLFLKIMGWIEKIQKLTIPK